jgi:hypothetical protein
LYNIHHHLPNKHKTGQKWQTTIITVVIWEQWYELWIMRNAEVHGKEDAATKTLVEKQEIKRQLEIIYNQRQHMEPSAQALLLPDIHTHLQQPPWVIQAWLNIKGPTFVQSLRTVKARGIQNGRSIREYYAAATAQPPV